MSSSDEGGSGSSSSSSTSQKRLRGIRRRKWGKWVSEIRVPGTQDRLWLGTYSSPEAAAVAHDIAKYCLKENTSMDDFNFPQMLPVGVQKGMSPRSVQKVATDAGMAIDAQFLSKRSSDSTVKPDENGTNWSAVDGRNWQCSNDDFSNNVIPSWDGNREGKDLDISVDDYL